MVWLVEIPEDQALNSGQRVLCDNMKHGKLPEEGVPHAISSINSKNASGKIPAGNLQIMESLK
jgi:hypothetical protein